MYVYMLVHIYTLKFIHILLASEMTWMSGIFYRINPQMFVKQQRHAFLKF